jgi:predicted transcriptional regulator
MEKKMTLSKIAKSDLQKDFEEFQTKALSDDAAVEPVLPLLFGLDASKKMLAEALGISQTAMTFYAQGRRRLPDKHRKALYDVLEIAVEAAENVKKRREHTKKLAKQGLLFDVHRAFMPKLKPQERKRLEENGEWRYKYFLDNLKRSKALLKKGPE